MQRELNLDVIIELLRLRRFLMQKNIRAPNLSRLFRIKRLILQKGRRDNCGVLGAKNYSMSTNFWHESCDCEEAIHKRRQKLKGERGQNSLKFADG